MNATAPLKPHSLVPTKSGRGHITRHSHPKRSLIKRIYVSVLLALLPLLVNLAALFSKKVRAEGAYLGQGFTFRMAISGYAGQRAMRKARVGWRYYPRTEPVELTITFRDLDYAFDIFSGGITLKQALAARLFSTHGPNDKGVSVTYLFTVILTAFFGWRSAYRR